MTRTIKQDIDLLLDIRDQVISRINPDFTMKDEVDQCYSAIHLIFENQNKWLLSDKISSEKQFRMDQFKNEKMGTSGGEESPTQKQINYATMLGINVEGKSKKEVSELIEKAKKTEPRK